MLLAQLQITENSRPVNVSFFDPSSLTSFLLKHPDITLYGLQSLKIYNPSEDEFIPFEDLYCSKEKPDEDEE